MIISCDQCLKKFEIDSKLIPDEGRLLQCSSCHNKWFYKKDIQEKTKVISEHQEIHDEKKKTAIISEHQEIHDEKKETTIKRKHSYKHTETKKLSSLNFILVFIISIVALIILLDTFKNPFSLIFPEIEFILESLYETLKDITLFIQDLF